MLLFSFANWDEILQICNGLCHGQEGIQNDDFHQLGEILCNPGERTTPFINEPAESFKKEHQHDVA